MPPDVLHFRALLSPLVAFSPPLITQAAQENQPCIHKYWQGTKGGMNLTKKKLIPILVLVLSVISVVRLLSLTVNKISPSSSGIFALSPAPQHICSPLLSTCNNHAPKSSEQPRRPPNNTTSLTEREFKVISDLVALKSPCNLLIFGFQPQYLVLSYINAAGSTIFLEDDPDKLSEARIHSNITQIYKIEYDMPAKAAYKLLKHARQNPACVPPPNTTFLQKSKCKLALKNLPSQVYEKNWDVMVVDGPIGDSPESPGRMATIYTAGVLARAGNSSDVLVHDVDRMIEKWFSWEFLCDENLLYSKGKLWHFRISSSNSNSTRFCPARESRTVQ